MTIQGATEFREGRAQQVAGLAALDRYTVRVTLTETPVPFVSVLAVGQAKIVPRELVEEQGEAFGSQPVGTGPFRFVRWERGKEIVLAANPEYFDGPPKLTRLVFRIFPGSGSTGSSPSSRPGRSRTPRSPPRTTVRSSPARRYQYVRRPMFNLRHYGINTRMKPLDDRRVRQAIVYAIDREAIVAEVWLGRYALARGILPPGTLGYNPKLKGYPHDPARARELLAQAGYPGGAGSRRSRSGRACAEEILREHERIRKDLEAVGVTTEFQYNPDWPSFSKAMAERKLPMFLRAWFADVPDPENFLPSCSTPPAPGTTSATRARRWTRSSRRRGRIGHGAPGRGLPAGGGDDPGGRSRDPGLAPDLRAPVPALRQGRRGQRAR